MKKRTGAVAMKHAKAILERDYLVIQYSGKRIVRIPDQAEPGGFRIIALSEDLWNGCFDAIAAGAHVLAVQVTTQTDARSSVAQRQRKIEAGFLKWFPPRIVLPFAVQIWSWVNREGFRVWSWCHETREWVEREETLSSPLLKR